MQFGTTIRNMGVQSSAGMVAQCVEVCEKMALQGALESVWITDHIAIPPDDAEGSGGRYLDPLTTLAWLAGQTRALQLGTSVLILPYRAKLPVAKQIATLQEVSGERLILGVGIGWMDAEFAALGVDRHKRGAISDDTLAFLNECFAKDVVELNGQAFLFKPRPKKPPILVGGRAPHALQRAVSYGDGWMPMVGSPDKLRDDIVRYRELTAARGRRPGSVTAMTGLPLSPSEPGYEINQVRDLLSAYREVGVDRLVCSIRYESIREFTAGIERLSERAGEFAD